MGQGIAKSLHRDGVGAYRRGGRRWLQRPLVAVPASQRPSSAALSSACLVGSVQVCPDLPACASLSPSRDGVRWGGYEASSKLSGEDEGEEGVPPDSITMLLPPPPGYDSIRFDDYAQ
ncbi:hypothetical protein LXL04_012245 [Taraxacum kok-saghyz]